LTCPNLSLSGPAGIPKPNGIVRYTANVDTKGQVLNLEYIWRLSKGDIINGQGTPNIEFKWPDLESGNLMVTVEVKGPEGCSTKADELVHWDAAPKPIKLAPFEGSSSAENEVEMNKIVRMLNDNPNNHLFVIFGYKKGTLQQTRSAEQEKRLIYLTASGLDGSRITFHSVQSCVDLVQFWRVPPGAPNPTCKECEQPVCPTISVEIPGGIVDPGELGTYKAILYGADPQISFEYVWSVGGGTSSKDKARQQ